MSATVCPEQAPTSRRERRGPDRRDMGARCHEEISTRGRDAREAGARKKGIEEAWTGRAANASVSPILLKESLPD